VNEKSHFIVAFFLQTMFLVGMMLKTKLKSSASSYKALRMNFTLFLPGPTTANAPHNPLQWGIAHLNAWVGAV
jgi:hypothetical protein